LALQAPTPVPAIVTYVGLATAVILNKTGYLTESFSKYPSIYGPRKQIGIYILTGSGVGVDVGILIGYVVVVIGGLVASITTTGV
jgi:hypothetical protein